MNKVIFNKSNVMKSVSCSDGKVYYIPPKSKVKLPKGVLVNNLDKDLKICK